MTSDNASSVKNPLEAIEAQLLNVIQVAIPLVPRPFAELGAALGLTEAQVLECLKILKCEKRVIRQMGAIFDTQSLGYQSTLVAASYAPERLAEAAGVISGHPGVSHNYERQHAFNLWYTLAVPPDSRLGLARTLELLHQCSGAISTRALPTLQLFKIGVKLDLGDASEGGGFNQADRAEAMSYGLEAGDPALVRVLQEDLPLVPEPFALLGERFGVSGEAVLEAGKRFLERKQMRRYAAVLRHREAGFTANVMGVWVAPEERLEAYGRQLAAYRQVSHCYHRPTYADWPFNLFTMIHGRSREECLQTLAQMRQETGLSTGEALWSLREFKKVRVRYFTPEIPLWEAGESQKIGFGL